MLRVSWRIGIFLDKMDKNNKENNIEDIIHDTYSYITIYITIYKFIINISFDYIKKDDYVMTVEKNKQPIRSLKTNVA